MRGRLLMVAVMACITLGIGCFVAGFLGLPSNHNEVAYFVSGGATALGGALLGAGS